MPDIDPHVGLHPRTGPEAAELQGGVVGVARAVNVFAIIALEAALAGFDRDPAWSGARCRPLLDEITARLMPHLPLRPAGVLRAA